MNRRTRFILRGLLGVALLLACGIVASMRLSLAQRQRLERLQAAGIVRTPLDTGQSGVLPQKLGSLAAWKHRLFGTETVRWITIDGERHREQLPRLRNELTCIDLDDLDGLILRNLPSLAGTPPWPARCPSMRVIAAMNCQFTDANLAALPDAPELLRVYLEGEQSIKPTGLLALTKYPKLRALNFRNTNMADVGWEATLQALPAVSALDLRGSRAGHEAMRAIKGMAPRWQYLVLSGTAVTDADCAGWPMMPSLETLELADTSITGAGLFANGVPPGLTWLRLGRCPLSPAAVSVWAGQMKAKVVDLSGTPIGDAGLEGIVSNSLESLQLAGCPATDAGIAKLAGCGGLVYLNLTSTQITDASAPVLLALPKLKSLRVTGTALSPEVCEQLRRANVEVTGP